MIEKTLERIAVALERLAFGITPAPAVAGPAEPTLVPEIQEAPEAPAPKKGKTAKTPPPAAAKAEITTDDIAAALRAFVTVKGKPAAVAVFKKYSATRLSELKPEDYGKILADFTLTEGK